MAGAGKETRMEVKTELDKVVPGNRTPSPFDESEPWLLTAAVTGGVGLLFYAVNAFISLWG